MSRNWVISGLAATLLVLIMSSSGARAEETAAAPVPEDPPLVVSGVHVDKTDKNAVLARDAAIGEARRLAFQMLAARNMGEVAGKNVAVPPDSTLMSVVRDFEITREQLSATRYVADFTVRFNEGVYNYINMKPGGGAMPGAAAGAGRAILVLPYLELNPDKRLLWEDGNMWMDAWRNPDLPVPAGWTVTLPFGDIEDVSAGPADSVWLGDYALLDALRARYGAPEIILAVATPAAAGMSVDLYSYGADGFADLFSLASVAPSGDEATAFRQAAAETLAALQEPVALPTMGGNTLSVPGEDMVVPDAPPQVAAAGDGNGGALALDAEMVFSNPARWLEMQKRLSTLTPPVRVDIRALSSNSASFTLRFDGTIETLRSLLSTEGVGLEPIGVNVAADGGGGPTRQTVYALGFIE